MRAINDVIRVQPPAQESSLRCILMRRASPSRLEAHRGGQEAMATQAEMAVGGRMATTTPRGGLFTSIKWT
eukprot:6792185-Pyramimonas_sp.AAC.1